MIYDVCYHYVTLLRDLSSTVHLGHKFSVVSVFYVEILFFVFGHLQRAMLPSMKMSLV